MIEPQQTETLAGLGGLITRDGQVQYRGLLMGAGTPYRWRELTGWHGLPEVDSGNTPRPSRHGAWPGRKLAQQRIITLTGPVRCPAAELPDVLDQLEDATVLPDDEQEYPLVVRERDAPLAVWAVCTGREIASGLRMSAGIPTYSLQFVASDPRRYTTFQERATIYPPAASGGLDFPLVFPLDFGQAGTGGSRILTNRGNTATWPVIDLHGAMGTPRLVNSRTGHQLEIGMQLAPVDVLTIDTYAGTITLNGTADRLYELTSLSGPVQDMYLKPGANDVALTAATWQDSARAQVRWRHAKL